MAATLSFMRAVVLEQKERTNKCSKAVVERLIEESESRIASLESQISALVDLRDRERGCVAALRHIISPIHILPVELLAEIFELSIRSDYQQVEDVFRISQVCSDWRQVAHSTSRLWIRPLYIDLRPGKSTDGEGYAEGLKTWFLRSTPLAIPVSFILDYHHVDCRIPDGVLSTAPRWRSLRLNVSSYTPPPFVRQLAEGRFDSLEELNLGLLKIDEADTAPSFTTVPRLQKLRMNVGSHALPILVPWHQLTDLTLRTRFPNIALDILGQCTNLIQADVTSQHFNYGHQASPSSIFRTRPSHRTT